MSKWALLKSAITGNPDVKTDADSISIHRFKGFEVIAKQKVIWKGFKLQICMKPAETDGVSEQCSCGADQGRNRADDPFKNCCEVCCSRIQHFEDFLNMSYKFLSATDIQESLIQVDCTGETPHLELLERLIKQGKGLKKYRLQNSKRENVNCNRTQNANVKSSEGTTSSLEAAFYIQAASLESSSRSCQYYVYDLKFENLGINFDPFSESAIRKILYEETLKGKESRKCDSSDEQDSASTVSSNRAETGVERNNIEVEHPHVSYNIDYKLNSAQVERGRGGGGRGEENENKVASLTSMSVFTREQTPTARVKGPGLLSHFLHGVDNTGNIRVWSSECMLLFTILTSHTLSALVKDSAVLELGGGMTALCGLGLSLTGLAKRVMITDGHPDCVLNQRTCIQMNEQHSDTQRETATGALSSTKLNESSVRYGHNIRTALLRWSHGDSNGDLGRIVGERFDIVIAADCLFFKDFHDDFLYVLTHSLRPGGFCFLLQPRRGGTVDLFLEKVTSSSDFDIVCITEDYSVEISRLRAQYREEEELKKKMTYVEDIHYPIFICLKRR